MHPRVLALTVLLLHHVLPSNGPAPPCRSCLQQPQGAWRAGNPGIPGTLAAYACAEGHVRTACRLQANLAAYDPATRPPAARPRLLQGMRAAPPRQAAQRKAVFRNSMVEPELPFAFRSSMADPPLRGRS